MKKNLILIFVLSTVLTACVGKQDALKKAIDSITADSLKPDIAALASDEFQGRAPASYGEEKTINYLARRFASLGLKPANNGSYFQEVSLLRIMTGPNVSLSFSGKKTVDMNWTVDFIGSSPQLSDSISIDGSDVVFAGYGIESPEWSWNDFAGTDVKGKTIIVLVNDPGYATGDTTLFTGHSMTYYGRWTYKYEEAARLGAKAVLIVHETGAAGYPWEVVRNSWAGPQFYLDDNELTKSGLLFKGWLTTEAATKLFASNGLDFNSLKESASKRGFKPVSLNSKLSVHFRNIVEHMKSNNVAALLPGSDRNDELVIYTAHWDHFGINNSFKGDSILNGAVDNATGTAALITLARAFKNLPVKQNRSVLFLSVTCEEQGLLGSEYYVKHPLFPLNKTVAVINMDALNIFGRTKDMTVVGYGNSQLDDYVVNVLKKYGRYASPDPSPEKGGFFRSDHFSFAKAGVPSLYVSEGVDNVDHGKQWGMERAANWIMENYHKPSDNYEPDKWNFDGMTEDLKVYFETGYDLSVSKEFPEWSKGFQFKNLHDSMMRK